jgi:hypothetical protein
MSSEDLNKRLAVLETKLQVARKKLAAARSEKFDAEFTLRLTQSRLDAIDLLKEEIAHVRAQLK